MAPVGWTGRGLYLALETSTEPGSVALARDGQLLGGRSLVPADHATRLLPAIRDLMDEAGVRPEELDGVVVGSGPGSFTGVRVAAATAKGLVRALEVPLWAVSSLEAAALAAGDPDDGARAILFDARGDRVYGACYRVRREGMETVLPPRADRLSSFLRAGFPPGVRFGGDGAARHAEAIVAAGFRTFDPPDAHPSADALLAVLTLTAGRAPVGDPGAWEPEYLKEWRADRGTA